MKYECELLLIINWNILPSYFGVLNDIFHLAPTHRIYMPFKMVPHILSLKWEKVIRMKICQTILDQILFIKMRKQSSENTMICYIVWWRMCILNRCKASKARHIDTHIVSSFLFLPVVLWFNCKIGAAADARSYVRSFSGTKSLYI